MRFLAILLLACFLQPVFAEEVVVPGIGSVWESTSIYEANAETGSSAHSRKDFVTVERMHEGRPVFAGVLRGFKGEIFQTKDGAVAYEDQCKYNVPMEKFEPPVIPNQCGWHLCSAPPMGEVFTRKMIIYALLLGCGPSDALYTFRSVRTVEHDGVPVTIGNAEMSLLDKSKSKKGKYKSMGKWQSYIRDGVGEVYAEGNGRVTTYNKVVVRLVPYKRVEMAGQTK